jgi:hypothetical protein
MNGFISAIHEYDPSELIPVEQIINKSELTVDDVKTCNNESDLYYNIELKVIDLLQSLDNIRKQTEVGAHPIIDEIEETCYLLICVVDNYTDRVVDLVEYYEDNKTNLEGKPTVLPGEKRYTTVEDFTLDYGDGLPSDKTNKFAKNRQKFVQEMFIELLISTEDFNNEKIQHTVEKQVVEMMMTVDWSYTTKTLVRNDAPTEDTPHPSKYNQISVKTI